MFDRLKSYKRIHGDCLVPEKYKEDPRGYFDHLPAPLDEKYQLTPELKDKLAALATLAPTDTVDEQTIDLMVNHYFTEQPDIW